MLELLWCWKELPSGGWWWACWKLGDIPWQCSRHHCEQEIQHHAYVYSLFDRRKLCVLPLLLFSQSSTISFHRVQGCSICTCPFHVIVQPGVSPQLLVTLWSMCPWWCLFYESSLMHQLHISHLCAGGRRDPCWPGERPIRYGMVACFYKMVSHGQGATWRSLSLSRSTTWPLSS